MGFELVDRYLLGEPVSKPAALAALLAERSPDAAAAPFYRALDAVGARAADEAFIALRLVLAGRAPADEAVRRLRALAGVSRACRNNDRAGLDAVLKRDRAALADLAETAASDRAALGAAAAAAYHRELRG